MGNLEKMQAKGDIISYFFPFAQIKKSTKIQLGENIIYFFPLRPCNNCSTFRRCTIPVLGGKYGKREIKSYSRWTQSFL
jgi:hypothetical protein